MFNFSILAARATTVSFQQMFSFCVVSRHCVSNVFLVSDNLQIFQPIVLAIQILVVNLHAAWNWAYKRLPQRAMNGDMAVFAVFAGAKTQVMIGADIYFNVSKSYVASPSPTVLNACDGWDTRSNSLRRHFERSACGQQFFNGFNRFSSKRFAPRNATHLPRAVDRIQSLIPNDWSPFVHVGFST